LADSRAYHSILHENLHDFTLQYTHGFMHYIHFVRLLYTLLNHIVIWALKTVVVVPLFLKYSGHPVSLLQGSD